MQVNFQL